MKKQNGKESFKNDHYVVAIGASAGGLEAIHDFFDHMPENAGLSFVVIQHLSSDYKSLLVELVSKHTHMKVFEAENNMDIQKECVYVIPNNKLMTVGDGRLYLADKTDVKAPNTAIDTFLQTLARDKKNRAIAIILSGTGTDGSKGVQAIKEEGGMVIVQDPATARFDGMPQSAIATGKADIILPPQQMPEEIYSYIRETPVYIFNDGKIDHQLLEEVFRLVQKSSGFDFNQYKTATILRRLGKRMMQTGFKQLEDYVHFLHVDPNEAKSLSREFLINVTNFFRDKPAYDVLATKVIPELVNQKLPGDALKVWIVACSTGEEAYSIAILIDQYLQRVQKNLEVKIFATDIEESSIEYAAKNSYPLSIENDIDPSLLETYFIKGSKRYSVIPRIRKRIVFARHNVIRDPAFIKNDLVTCRNMLIYMNNNLQHKVLATLHYSVNDNGYLFFGSSETISFIKSGLEEIDGKWKIYKKTGSIQTNGHLMSRQLDDANIVPKKSGNISLKEPNKITSTIQSDFCDAISNDIGYAGFYIDNNYDIKESIGDYKKFLSLPEKQLNLNILKMVPRELSTPLNAAIRRCWKEKRKVLLRKVLRSGPKETILQIIVKPAAHALINSYTLIIIGENKHLPAEGGNGLPVFNNIEPDKYITELETELEETRNSLQAAVESMETTNEELQSTNEELLSANEELQSSNEELQSLNEELHTLNTEHQLKIKELIDLNDDLNNYFRSIDIGQVFVNSELEIRKFNPAAIKMINLIETDIGRPINHISTNLDYPEMITDLQEVITKNVNIEKEIVLRNGNSSLVRIIPYIRRDQMIDGAVITFVDITHKKASEIKLRKNYSELINVRERLKKLNAELEDTVKERTKELSASEERFRLVALATNDALWDWDIVRNRFWWGPNFYPMFGYQETDPVKSRNFWLQQIHPKDRQRINDLINTAIQQNEMKWSAEYRFMKADGKYAHILDRGYILRDEYNTPFRMVGSMLDITDQKEATKMLIQQKDEFMSIASHELKTPITSMKAFLQLIQRMMENKADPKVVHSFITKANSQINKLASLIEDLLDITKIQAGKIQFIVSDFVIGDAIQDCLDQVYHQSSRHQIIVEGDLTMVIAADRHRIEQVIVNFLSNAIKYSPDADKLILRVEQEAGNLRISVQDFGIGIPEDRKPYIFDRFFRVHQSSQKFSGLGLGLYISSEIIKRHNGEIGVDSEPNKGSVFWFTIPSKQKPE